MRKIALAVFFVLCLMVPLAEAQWDGGGIFPFPWDDWIPPGPIVPPVPDTPPVYQPKTYGLFFGVSQSNFDEENQIWKTLRGDLNAAYARNALSKLPAVYNPIDDMQCYSNSMEVGGLKQNFIQTKIDEIKPKLKAGDTFIIYFNAHGGSDILGNETSVNRGDEVLAIGANILSNYFPVPRIGLTDQDYLTDKELTGMLTNMDSINKWVIIDSCHSGGFWGGGDLETLHNITLLAASKEDTFTLFNGITGRSYFTLALEVGLQKEGNYFIADGFLPDGKIGVRDGKVDNDELVNFIKCAYRDESRLGDPDNITTAYAQDFGDQASGSLKDLTPETFNSPDFNGSLPAVPLPGTIWLFFGGLARILMLKRKRPGKKG